MQRYERLRQIRRLDPDRDWLTIYRLTATYEFPWDLTRALELALYRTYAVPSIGQLLDRTAELTERTQKRYDDTSLLLDTVVEHGFDSIQGRTAIRRINQMHRSYDISNDDMRYVLCTFVVVPRRWIDTYGWRRLSRHEVIASAHYYRALGRHMGIQGIPESYEEFETCLDTYEAEHFGRDEAGRRVSDATLTLMASWYPGVLEPVLKKATVALLDEPLLRGRAVRLLPPRRAPHQARQNWEIKSYPKGYRVDELGTFPTPGLRGCPVPHAAPPGEGSADHRPPPRTT
ncbi:oxygenase MpaB family protein [Streptomyces sp. NPDC001940]